MARELPQLPGARVEAVDANAYFARPGPRYAEGVEVLAGIFDPLTPPQRKCGRTPKRPTAFCEDQGATSGSSR